MRPQRAPAQEGRAQTRAEHSSLRARVCSRILPRLQSMVAERATRLVQPLTAPNRFPNLLLGISNGHRHCENGFLVFARNYHDAVRIASQEVSRAHPHPTQINSDVGGFD